MRFVQHGSVRCYPPCCQYHCPTTSSKNVLYRLGNKYTDQQSATAGPYWLSPTQGFEIGGSPVSIPQYMSSHLNKCVDGIIAELTRFEEFINIPVGSPKARLQLVYACQTPVNLCILGGISTRFKQCQSSEVCGRVAHGY